MNPQEYRYLQAELSTLEHLLLQLPPDRVIERMGLEARKQDVQQELASQQVPLREPVRAHLTFRGRPIVSSYGIFAEFGAAAINTFTEAVAAIGASLAGPLGSRGALPNREDYRMLITGTATGSFGFQLEEVPSEVMELLPQITPIELAIEQTKAIMQASLGTDDELTEAVSEADPRALDALRKFFEILASNEAVCALEFKDDVFRFSDVAQVRQSLERIKQSNIHEEDRQLRGRFQGALPNRRTFEFRLDKGNVVIVGKVGKDIRDAAAINQILEKPSTIQVHTRQLGSGRPAYVLVSYSPLEGEQGEPMRV